MRRRWVAGVVLAMVVSLAAPAASDPNRSIVRIKSGFDGWSVIHSVCVLLGCQVTRSLDTLPGETAASSLFLVQNLPVITPLVQAQLDLMGVEAMEVDLPVGVALDPSWRSAQATAAVLDLLADRTPVAYFGSAPWRGYLEQPAAQIVRLRESQCAFGFTGGGTVAVIDTGVDLDHPTLSPFLVAGYDFTRDVQGGNERADVDQATAAVLDRAFAVNQATAAVLDQATAAVLDDPAHAAFGHGTMVSGVLHLVAPTATIMPLKAFAASGDGYTSDILRAVYFAVARGAKVLNMSFSRSTPSSEIERALNHATSHGLIAVASAGNEGVQAPRYPAASSNVMGVASTANDDTRSSFSNYGAGFVWVAAPGEGVITTYPWGSFAAAWGTSFSTPMVAGAAAVLAGMEGSTTQDQVASLVAHAQPLTPDLGHGRLDVYQAVDYAWRLWPTAAPHPAPDGCAQSPPVAP